MSRQNPRTRRPRDSIPPMLKGAAPRVRPRMPMEARVDVERHPPRGRIRTTEEGELSEVSWNVKVALVLLGVFVVSLPLAGLLAAVAGPWWGTAPLGLAVSSYAAARLLGDE